MDIVVALVAVVTEPILAFRKVLAVVAQARLSGIQLFWPWLAAAAVQVVTVAL